MKKTLIDIKKKSERMASILLSHCMYYLSPYSYDHKKYRNTFLKKEYTHLADLSNAPKRIFVFWTGDNEMSENRELCLDSIRKKTEVEVILVTPQNINEYVLENYPLHKAYSFLSNVHKSDYLRCYFMLHYGGGYSDIKRHKYSWVDSFDRLNDAHDKWCLSYQEIGPHGVVNIAGKLGTDIKLNYLYLGGICSFIFKPYSPIAKEWMEEVVIRLDTLYDALRDSPATDPFGYGGNYPVTWSYIMGDILHPLYLKYNQKIILSDRIRPIFTNYR